MPLDTLFLNQTVCYVHQFQQSCNVSTKSIQANLGYGTICEKLLTIKSNNSGATTGKILKI